MCSLYVCYHCLVLLTPSLSLVHCTVPSHCSQQLGSTPTHPSPIPHLNNHSPCKYPDFYVIVPSVLLDLFVLPACTISLVPLNSWFWIYLLACLWSLSIFDFCLWPDLFSWALKASYLPVCLLVCVWVFSLPVVSNMFCDPTQEISPLKLTWFRHGVTE